VATDSQGHVLASDYDNHCVHILNEAGQLVFLIKNLRKPEKISFDDKDNDLFLMERGGGLKVINYLQQDWDRKLWDDFGFSSLYIH
jgi:hypothetical protein